MIRIHSRIKSPKAGPGGLRPGMEVLHLVSEGMDTQVQRMDLIIFIERLQLPKLVEKAILSNPHLDKKRPHLDLWGDPARIAEAWLISYHTGPVDLTPYGA